MVLFLRGNLKEIRGTSIIQRHSAQGLELKGQGPGTGFSFLLLLRGGSRGGGRIFIFHVVGDQQPAPAASNPGEEPRAAGISSHICPGNCLFLSDPALLHFKEGAPQFQTA